MKKLIIIAIILTLFTGLTAADRGIDPIPETQGITIATTLDAIGNFASTTDVQWRITDSEDGLAGVPPLNPDIVEGVGPAIYQSTYTEDSYSNGVGLIAYDKNTDVETKARLSGLWNIDATKQLEFVGTDGARVYSDENVMVDGVATPTWITAEMLCPFAAPDGSGGFAAYCNMAEAGSTIDMTVSNVRTNTMDRFVVPSADTAVELEHDIVVTELITDLPSIGSVSAFMNALIQEDYSPWFYDEMDLSERIEYSESTSIDGEITVFEKQMNYNSKLTGMRASSALI